MKINYILLTFSFFCILFFNSLSSSSGCSFKPSMTGDSLICSGNTGNYSTTKVTSHFYRWIVRGGGSIVSGQSTVALVVLWPNATNIGKVVLIDSTTGCYDSARLTVKVGLSQATLQSNPFNTLGTASQTGKKIYSVTTGSNNQYGAAWCINSVSLNKNWDFTFELTQCPGPSPLADGMMFVIQNNGPNTPPSTTEGSDLGYYAAPSGLFAQSIGMEFDIYQSTSTFFDSSASHMSLVKNDDPTPLRHQIDITSPVLGGGSPCGPRVFRIVWNRSLNLMDFYFDGKKKFSWSNDVVKNVFGGNPNVWFGLTGATGGLNSYQSISIDTMFYGIPIITASKDTACTGDSVTLTCSSAISYLWSTGAKTRVIKVGKTGSYSVITSDSTKCTSPSSPYNITFIPKDSAIFTVGAAACQGSFISLTNSSTPSTGLNYLWKFGSGKDSSLSQSPGYKYNTPGTYTINLSVSNSGCTSKASKTISIYPSPAGSGFIAGVPFHGQFNSGDATNPDNICINDTITYQILPPKAFANSDYGSKWIINSIKFSTPYGLGIKDTATKFPTSSKNGTFSFFPKKYGDSTFLLTIDLKTVQGNCDSVIRRQIHVRNIPVAKFTAVNACQGFAATFTDASTDVAASVTNWAWDFGDGKTSNAQNPSHVYPNAGTYTVKLIASTDAGCSNTVINTVTSYPVPKTSYTDVLGCNGKSTTFTDNSTIASPGVIKLWNWNFGDGLLSNTQNTTHTYKKSGPYNVKLAIVSANGCKDSLTTKIRVLPSPIAGFSYLNGCVNTPIFFSNTSVDSTNKSVYSWDFGDKTTPSTATVPTHTYTVNGTYKIVLSVTSGQGCIDTISKIITPLPKPNPNIHAPNGCTGQTITLSDSSHSDKNSVYTWDFGDGTTPATIKTVSTKHTYTKAKNYKAILSITNGNGCTDTQSHVIIIMDFPKAGFTATTACQGKPTNFTNTSTGTGTLGYVWSFGDGSPLNITLSPSYTYATGGAFVARLRVVNLNGCIDSSSVNVTVNPSPVINPWIYKKHGYQVTFIPADSSIGNFNWHFGTSTNDSSSAKKPTFIYASTDATYTVKLTVTSTFGCIATRTDTVSVTKSGISFQGNTLKGVSVYPNPFEGSTNISYKLLSKSKVSIGIYDVQGKEIARIKNGDYPAGDYIDTFDAGKYGLSEGIYFLKMYVNDKTFATKLVNQK